MSLWISHSAVQRTSSDPAAPTDWFESNSSEFLPHARPLDPCLPGCNSGYSDYHTPTTRRARRCSNLSIRVCSEGSRHFGLLFIILFRVALLHAGSGRAHLPSHLNSVDVVTARCRVWNRAHLERGGDHGVVASESVCPCLSKESDGLEAELGNEVFGGEAQDAGEEKEVIRISLLECTENI